MSYKEIRKIIDENNKEINSKLDRLITKTEAIHIQATKTNGRVNTIEGKCDFFDRKINELEQTDKLQNKWINSTQGKLIVAGVIVSILVSFATALV